jgi:formylglycine-generating enzyme required for sulfatase activity
MNTHRRFRFLFICLGVCLSIPTIYAQSRLGEQQKGERRVAHVIGMKDYANIKPLKKPINDSNDMEQALTKLNFQVTKFTDAETKTLRYGIDRFVAGLRENDVVFVYYSGHGVGFEGDNYLLPVDANPRCRETVSYEGVSTNKFMTDVELRNAKNVFVIFEACRSLLYGEDLESCKETGKSIYSQIGWEIPKNNPKGSIMVLATSVGKISDDNIAGRNGLFTEGLLPDITTPNLTFEQIFKLAAKQTAKKSQGKQMPVIGLNTVYDDFVFVKTNTSTPKENFILTTPTPPTTKKFLDLPFAEMSFIKGGTFKMGSNESDDEKPIHTVIVSDFWMRKYEVTVKQYLVFCIETQSHYPEWMENGNKYNINTGSGNHYKLLGPSLTDENYPIVGISYKDAEAFCAWLRKKEGIKYRLPTEAEWEYAAGNGTNHNKFSWGDSEPSSKSGNLDGQADGYAFTSPVGTYSPNNFGLHDMCCSVWCSDWYGSDYYKASPESNPTGPSTGFRHVLRGGSWNGSSRLSRVAIRYYNYDSYRINDFGFRAVSLQ